MINDFILFFVIFSGKYIQVPTSPTLLPFISLELFHGPEIKWNDVYVNWVIDL